MSLDGLRARRRSRWRSRLATSSCTHSRVMSSTFRAHFGSCDAVTSATAEQSSSFARRRSVTSSGARSRCSGAARRVSLRTWAISIPSERRITTWSQAGAFSSFPLRSRAHFLPRSPALVANLWDVTDKDIDKFSDAVFRKLGLNGEARDEDDPGPTLAAAIGGSRDVCLLRYLNGAAPVVYGVPVRLSRIAA